MDASLYLSVSSGTMRIRSFGLKERALSMNLLAKDALTPKGGFSPMIYSIMKKNSKKHTSIDLINPYHIGESKTCLGKNKGIKKQNTSLDPRGSSFGSTVIQLLFSKLKSFYKKEQLLQSKYKLKVHTCTHEEILALNKEKEVIAADKVLISH